MADTIRQDVVAIDFEVGDNPFSEITEGIDEVVAAVQELVSVAKAGFEGLGVSADAFASGMDSAAASVDAAASGMAGSVQQAQAFGSVAGNITTSFEDMTAKASAMNPALAGMSSGVQDTANSAQQAVRGISEMAAALAKTVASKIGEVPEKIKSSASAAKEFAAMLKATTFDKVTSGADKLKAAMTSLKGMSIKDIAKGLDLQLGKAATKALELGRKLKDSVTGGKGLGTTLKDIARTAFDKVTSGIKNMAASMKSAESSASSLGSSLKTGIMSVFGGQLLAGAVQKGIGAITSQFSSAMSRIDTTEQFNRVLNAMPAVADAAAATGVSVENMVSQVSDATTGIVTDTAYGLETAMTGVQNLISRGIDPLRATDAIQAMADATTFYAGGSDENFGRVNDALSSMVTAGRVSMQEMNMLMDAGIPALDIYADATGQSTQQVRDAISSGAMDAQEFMTTMTNALEEGTERFPALAGAAMEAGASWTGTFDNMKAALSRGLSSILESVDSVVGGAGLGNMRQVLLDVGRGVGNFMEVLSGSKSAAEVFPTIAQGLNNFGTALSALGQSVASSLQGIMGDLPQLGVAGANMVSGLLQGILSAAPMILLAGLQLLMGFAQGLVQNLPMIMSVGIQAIAMLVNGIAQMAPQLLVLAAQLLIQFAMGLVQNLPMLIEAGVNLIVALIEGLATALPMLIEMVPYLFMAFIEAIMAIDWLDVGVRIITAIVDGVMGVLGSLAGILEGGIESLITGEPFEMPTVDSSSATASATAAGTETGTALATGFESSIDMADFSVPEIDMSGMTNALSTVTPSMEAFGTTATSAQMGMDSFATAATTGSASVQTMSTDVTTLGTNMQTLDTTMTTVSTNMGLSLDTLKQKMTETQTAMSTEMTTITTNTQNMATQIVVVLTPLATTLFTVGLNAMQGFNNGLASMRGAVMATAQSIANEVSTTMQAALDINSPSRVIEQIGRFAGMALPLGMETQRQDVQKEAQALALAAVPPAEIMTNRGTQSRTADNSPATTQGGVGAHVTNHYSPQFTLTIGSGATASDREMERKVKNWVREAFERVINNAERGTGSAVEV
ncbi:tape measure protein [Ruminococcaceae bacterium OttesenSCG-928-I18]|nr:tape measure protein [Ruminococcaceae bacterium OttesenSCG-928-I18]